MIVLSLFDGMSCGQIALNRIGITPCKYYASEIDKFSIKVTQANYPNTIQLGDVTKWKDWDINWSEIDLVSGGFPCQAWSTAGKQLGDKDPRGMLFWTMLDVMQTVLSHNPNAKFLMENVKMKSEFEQYITFHTEQALGKVNKHLINSALVSAQNRQRYYWTNIDGVTQPEDKGLVLQDILEDVFLPEFETKPHPDYVDGNQLNPHYKSQANTIHEPNKKSPTICAGTHGYGLGHVKLRPCEPIETTSNHVANATDIKGHDIIKRVYSPEGKCPTLTTMTGGHREPKVLVEPIETTPNHPPKVLWRPASIVGRRLNERGVRDDYNKDVPITQCLQVKHDTNKTGTLTTVEKDNVLSTEPPGRYPNAFEGEYKYRKLTPLECERLQTVPDFYTNHVSNSQRYKMLGNGFTVDVIAHIYKQLKETS